MAFLHKISGYLVDINEEYFEEDIVTELEERLDLSSQHLHVETAEVEAGMMRTHSTIEIAILQSVKSILKQMYIR